MTLYQEIPKVSILAVLRQHYREQDANQQYQELIQLVENCQTIDQLNQSLLNRISRYPQSSRTFKTLGNQSDIRSMS